MLAVIYQLTSTYSSTGNWERLVLKVDIKVLTTWVYYFPIKVWLKAHYSSVFSLDDKLLLPENCGRGLRHNISLTDQSPIRLTFCWLQYIPLPISWEYNNIDKFMIQWNRYGFCWIGYLPVKVKIIGQHNFVPIFSIKHQLF